MQVHIHDVCMIQAGAGIFFVLGPQRLCDIYTDLWELPLYTVVTSSQVIIWEYQAFHAGSYQLVIPSGSYHIYGTCQLPYYFPAPTAATTLSNILNQKCILLRVVRSGGDLSEQIVERVGKVLKISRDVWKWMSRKTDQYFCYVN